MRVIDLQKNLPVLLDITAEAGAAIQALYGPGPIEVSLKSDNSPVTQADIASSRIICDRLLEHFPGIPVVNEEGGETENKQIVQSKLFWLVDPLDGTKEFIAKNGEFTICIALIEGDAPTFGIVAAPALGVTYYGGPTMGSYKKRDGQTPEAIHVSATPTNVILGSRSHFEEATAAYINDHFEHAEIQSVGSQLKLAQIAEGLADAFPRLNHSMRLWDLAAGQAILEGAGGSVTRPDGSPIDYHAQTLMAGDFVARSLRLLP